MNLQDRFFRMTKINLSSCRPKKSKCYSGQLLMSSLYYLTRSHQSSGVICHTENIKRYQLNIRIKYNLRQSLQKFGDPFSCVMYQHDQLSFRSPQRPSIYNLTYSTSIILRNVSNDVMQSLLLLWCCKYIIQQTKAMLLNLNIFRLMLQLNVTVWKYWL